MPGERSSTRGVTAPRDDHSAAKSAAETKSSALTDPRRRQHHSWWDEALAPVDRVFDSVLEDFWDPAFPTLGRLGALTRDLERSMMRHMPHSRGFPTDVVEHDDHISMEVEVPGVPKENIHVQMRDGFLQIKAERKEEKKEERDGKVVRSERSYGRFERNYKLPRTADLAGIKAKNENGVLTITIPKKPAAAIEDAHEIPVE